ncbi:hypothetical protein SPLC1_S011780 [Arthrospira platensis C1]|nr:hypothetical protein SPLC1_S011780 [Arthrospira platensis C1]
MLGQPPETGQDCWTLSQCWLRVEWVCDRFRWYGQLQKKIQC